MLSKSLCCALFGITSLPVASFADTQNFYELVPAIDQDITTQTFDNLPQNPNKSLPNAYPSDQNPQPNHHANYQIVSASTPTLETYQNSNKTPSDVLDINRYANGVSIDEDASLSATQLDKDTLTQPNTNTEPNHTLYSPASTIYQKNDAIPANPKTSLDTLASLYQATKKGRRCQGNWLMPPIDVPNFLDNDNTKSYAYADYGYYDNVDYAELIGNVVVLQDGKKVLADTLTLNTKSGAMSADGRVLFSDYANDLGLIGISKNAKFDTGQAVATDVAFASQSIKAHGYAKTLQANKNRYLLNNAMFSTCPPDDRKWYIQASDITLDKDSGRGIAKHTTLKIKDVPVLYLPYFNFPIDNRRATGFLLPNAGFDSDNGLQISTPYYLNLASNYDATLTPTFYTNRNPRTLSEFRYLTQNFGTGTLQAGYLPQDKQYFGKNRSHLFYDHSWQSKRLPNLSGYANYRYVSDNGYLSDFDQLGLTNNPLNLPRRIGLSYFDDYLTADLRGETYQSLKASDVSGNAILDKHKPYARLPQLSVDYRLPTHNLKGFENTIIEGVSQSAYFKKSINDGSEPEKSGVRLFNRLSISQPFVKSWGYFTPKVSATHLYTRYDEDSQIAQKLNKNNASRSIFVPQLSLDMGLHLQKSGSPFGLHTGGYQVLSPRIKYLYSPHKNQSDMPNFETVLTPMSYDQLLSDSWFLGYDRILDIHAVTPALNYRYIDNQGKTRLDASVAKQLHLQQSQAFLDNRRQADSLGLAWQVNARPWQNLWFDTSGSLTKDYDLNAFVGQVRYIPSTNALYNFGIIKRQEDPTIGQSAFSGLTAAAILPVYDNWQFITQAQYDNKRNQLMDALAGINYEDCCIGVSIYGREYRNDLNPNQKPNRAIMAELRLTGLTGRGSLFKMLNSKVVGVQNLSWLDQAP